MKLLLIRHGESTGNRDHIWAGITDNELTNHGFLQASKLSTYLKNLYADHAVLGVYSSDLTRARRTAGEIATGLEAEHTVTQLLREQDLGWREGRLIKDGDKNSAANISTAEKNPGESKADMDKRARIFISAFLQADFDTIRENSILIIVSHGLFLLRLYYQLTAHLHVQSPPAVSWSNTGCTTINVKSSSDATVTDVNSVQHLRGLKRTRAGVGSSQYDVKQQKVSEFFRHKRPPKASDETSRDSATLIIRARDASPAAIVQVSEEDVDLEAQIRAIDAACDQLQPRSA